MARAGQGAVLRQVRALFDAGTIGGLTDGQLLERFTTRGGEAAELAFAALVERHGPMVLRTCRAVLRDPHDAHDAFQATFLVLVRRAGSLWARDSLAPWLHQVARRTACCAGRPRPAGSGTSGRRPGGDGRRSGTRGRMTSAMSSTRRSTGCPSRSGRRSCSAWSRA